MKAFVVSECHEFGIIRELFLEYSKIKGAESCFVSFGNELDHLESFYSGGALLVGYENGTPMRWSLTTVSTMTSRSTIRLKARLARRWLPMSRGRWR